MSAFSQIHYRYPRLKSRPRILSVALYNIIHFIPLIKRTLPRIISSVLIMVGTSFSLYAQDATEIIRKMDEKARGLSSQSEISMTIVRPGWQRTVNMKAWSKGTDYSLILITDPPRDEGTAFLKRGNEIWNWVPNIGRVVKLPPSMMMQSWMGSDFTNDDLVQESSIIKDYVHTLLGDSLLSNQECYLIELIPKPEAPVVWGKLMIWVTQEEYIELRAEFYDEDGELITIMESFDVRDFDGRLLPARMEMSPLDKEGHKTILEYKTLRFDQDIKESFFSVQNMRRIR